MKQNEKEVQVLRQRLIKNSRRKYKNMPIIQLKKEKLRMVRDLQQINTLLDDLIQEQTVQSQNYAFSLDQQIIKSKRLIKTLSNSLQNFQFMLTGDYSVKLDEQIQQKKDNLKHMKQQINKFNRMLSVPIQKDIKICDDLLQQIYRLQKQIQQYKAKNIKKNQQFVHNTTQNQKKVQLLKQINKQSHQMNEKTQFQISMSKKQYEELLKSYQTAMTKKQKLTLVCERDKRRLHHIYKQKAQSFFSLDETSKQIQNCITQIAQNIKQRSSYLKAIKATKLPQQNSPSTRAHGRNSDSHAHYRRRNLTEQNSEIEILNRQREIHYMNMSRAKQRSQSNYITKSSTIRPMQVESSEQILPKLYKIMGKNKFQIQEDCDVRDLLYY